MRFKKETMNKILYNKLIAIPVCEVKLDALHLPTSGIQKYLYDFMKEIHFFSPSQFWMDSESHLLMDFPIYIKQKSTHAYTVIGGYRIFFIANFVDMKNIHAIDISAFSDEEQNEIAIHTTLYPLMLWTTKTNNLDVDLKRFLKTLFKDHPDTKKIAMKYAKISKSVSRFKGRTNIEPKSQLSKLIAQRLENNE